MLEVYGMWFGRPDDNGWRRCGSFQLKHNRYGWIVRYGQLTSTGDTANAAVHKLYWAVGNAWHDYHKLSNRKPPGQ